MAAHRVAMGRHGAGPDKPVAVFANYLRAEQAIQRIEPDADPDATASSIGACFHEAFLRYYTNGPAATAAPRARAAALAKATINSLR